LLFLIPRIGHDFFPPGRLVLGVAGISPPSWQVMRCFWVSAGLLADPTQLSSFFPKFSLAAPLPNVSLRWQPLEASRTIRDFMSFLLAYFSRNLCVLVSGTTSVLATFLATIEVSVFL